MRIDNSSIINKSDVVLVATMLNIEPTQERIDFVLSNFESEFNADPAGCIPLWIENLLYQTVDNK